MCIKVLYWFLFLQSYHLLAIVSNDSDNSIVQTEYGYIQGLITTTSRLFLGIPYATPPVDDLRWENPIEPSSWNDILQCTTISPGCIQNVPTSQLWSTTDEFSEDCLYLNIYTPSNQ